jgi:oligopeptide/dipeptide ABC transporter ATP-binding protein
VMRSSSTHCIRIQKPCFPQYLYPGRRRENAKPELIKGEITSPIDPKPGCRFAARCPMATAECRTGSVALREVSEGHFVSCIRC